MNKKLKIINMRIKLLEDMKKLLEAYKKLGDKDMLEFAKELGRDSETLKKKIEAMK